MSNGFYIDVGAFDPTIDSVTRLFYDHGWHGINVEPHPLYSSRLKEERLRDFNLQIALSDRTGTSSFYVVGNTGLSSLEKDYAQANPGQQDNIRDFSVRTETLSDIWDRYVPRDQEVHFLKIDVEGAERKVIAGAVWQLHRPWVLIVEANLPNSDIPSHSDWEPLLTAAKYDFAFFDGLNRYYVAKEREHLKGALSRPANAAVDNFKIYRTAELEREISFLQSKLEQQKPLSERVSQIESSLLRLSDYFNEFRLELGMIHLREHVSSLAVQSPKDRDRLNSTRVITALDVEAAYALLLNRKPESRDAITYHKKLGTLDEMLTQMLASPERSNHNTRADDLSARANASLSSRLSTISKTLFDTVFQTLPPTLSPREKIFFKALTKKSWRGTSNCG